MKIYFENRTPSIGAQIIDKWFAYQQSISQNFRPNIDFTTNTNADIKILIDYFFQQTSEKDLTEFDILLCCNGGEPISVSSPKIKEILKNSHCYLLCNSFGNNHKDIKDKLIWLPHNIMTCRDYWTRHFYPQPYENSRNSTIKRSSTIAFINGRNTAHREYFANILHTYIPNIEMRRSINPSPTKMQDSQWESEEDQEFREYINSRYPNLPDHVNDENYYSQSVTIGIDNKFGSIPPGYFVLPTYYQHSCVIFPETSWQNNELCITEKSLKCFHAGSLPFPIGGANINKLYNDVGFFTAWNLLPKDLQTFDRLKNHRERYVNAVKSIAWLQENPEVFKSDDFVRFTEHNLKNFLVCNADIQSVRQFDHIIQNSIRAHQKT